MTSIKPLSNSQKLFLQRLIVSLTLQPETSTHPSTTNSRREPDEDNGIDPTYMGNGFNHCLGVSQAALTTTRFTQVYPFSLSYGIVYPSTRANGTNTISSLCISVGIF